MRLWCSRVGRGGELPDPVVIDQIAFGKRFDSIQHLLHPGLGRFDTELFESMCDGPLAAVPSDHELDAFSPNPFGTVGEVGVGMLEQSILVDSGFG